MLILVLVLVLVGPVLVLFLVLAGLVLVLVLVLVGPVLVNITVGRCNEYASKGSDALQLGSKSSYGSCMEARTV